MTEGSSSRIRWRTFAPLIVLGSLLAIASSVGAVHSKEVPFVDYGGSGDELGAAVALHGDTAIAGAPSATVDGNEEQGTAHVYVREADEWEHQATLTAPDGQAEDRFGTAVDVHGDTVIVGALGATVAGNSSQGAAYIFEAPEGDWADAEATKLVASDGGSYERFGASVALAEQKFVAGSSLGALVGAPNARVQSVTPEGAAYLFAPVEGDWTDSEQKKLIAEDGDSFYDFGSSVALHQDRILVGAPGVSINDTIDQGVAYAFTSLLGDPATEAVRLERDPPEGSFGDAFGSSVDVHGGTFVVGAPDTDPDGDTSRGAAHVYSHEGESVVHEAELVAPNGETADYFGTSVAVHNDTVLVGAPGTDVNGSESQGATHRFVAGEPGVEADWTDATPRRLTASNRDIYDEFGSSVAVHQDERIFVGAPQADAWGSEEAGAVYAAELHLGVPPLPWDPPTLTIDEVAYEGDTLEVGEEAQISVTAEAGSWDLTLIEFAVDGETISEGTQDWTLWTPEAAGTHEVNATVTDVYGQNGTDEVPVDVEEAQEPADAPGVAALASIATLAASALVLRRR